MSTLTFFQSSDKYSNSENFKVVVRCRPLKEEEIDCGHERLVELWCIVKLFLLYNTVKPVHPVNSVKQSPVLKGHIFICPDIENFI